MKYRVFAYSDIGDRQNNEDCAAYCTAGDDLIAVAADGVGGSANGEIASRYAVSEIIAQAEKEQLSIDLLKRTIQQINADIREKQKACGNTMSTVALLWIHAAEQRAAVLNVGDSRIYQFRGGKIVFQSMDHSVAQIAVIMGEITQDEIRSYPGRNRLIRALGAEETVGVDCKELDVQAGDAFLLCSDGLWELVHEERMLTLMQESESAEDWIARLQAAVLESDAQKKDNHSAVAIMIE